MSNIKETIKSEIERLKNKNAEWRERINSEDGYSYESDVCCGYDEAIEDFETFINSLPEEKPIEDLEEAANEYASKTLCDPDDGPSTGLAKDAFTAGANYQRLKRLTEAAKSSSHLDAYIEGVRRSIEKQIGQLPPPPPGYYYTWELDTIRKEGQSFTAIARPLLKQINPEQ